MDKFSYNVIVFNNKMEEMSDKYSVCGFQGNILVRKLVYNGYRFYLDNCFVV